MDACYVKKTGEHSQLDGYQFYWHVYNDCLCTGQLQKSMSDYIAEQLKVTVIKGTPCQHWGLMLCVSCLLTFGQMRLKKNEVSPIWNEG